MSMLKWFDGKEWKPMYADEIKNLHERVVVLENLEIDRPSSDNVNELIEGQITNQSTAAERGSGPIKQSVPEKAYSSVEKKKITEVVADLISYAHRHAVVNVGEQLTYQCQCQCQCQCNCQCDCDCNCCSHCDYTPGCSHCDHIANCPHCTYTPPCTHCAHTTCPHCDYRPYTPPDCRCDCHDDSRSGGL